uniref:Uncharacterized protein n=1 Tax=Lactuca sativa TaxID=4236 RepID=A0A9R1XI58_LACSA|nr:hypothetical protein LSAT_V11C300144760 [Lactuca sativa]
MKKATWRGRNISFVRVLLVNELKKLSATNLCFQPQQLLLKYVHHFQTDFAGSHLHHLQPDVAHQILVLVSSYLQVTPTNFCKR